MKFNGLKRVTKCTAIVLTSHPAYIKEKEQKNRTFCDGFIKIELVIKNYFMYV